VFCRPLTWERVAPISRVFAWSKVVHHGALSRYPLLALNKLGISVSVRLAWGIFRFDDGLSSFVPGLRKTGSSVATLATKKSA
jgi:hypothetical protein